MRRAGFGLILLATTIAGCENHETPVATAPPEKTATNEAANLPTNDAANAGVHVAGNAASPASTGSQGGTTTDPEYSRINHLKDLKTMTVPIAGKPHRLWIMDDDSKRQEGMMFLTEKEVAKDQGMVFVFKFLQKDDGHHGFWMDNCPLGLDIIYLRANKTVLKIGDGVPFRKETVQPGGDYVYVVELRRGRSKEIGVKVGDKIEIPDALRATAKEDPPMPTG